MQILRTKQDVRNWVREQRDSGKSVGFVPTMGALHEGHKNLMQQAVSQTDSVIVSIFVNPTQFGPNEDYSRYPRTLESDVEIAESVGVKAVFVPDVQEMYVEKQHITFSITALNEHLCGRSRKGHFEGVLQVVNKLFNIVQPDKAFFGKKDIQQCVIIRKMVDELDLPVELVLGETVREKDGLALSSRNRYLSDEQRAIAPHLYQILGACKLEIVNSELVQKALNHALFTAEQVGFRIDYIELVNDSDLQPVQEIIHGKTYILAAAVFLGTTRLIDNIHFTF
ncbi:pantoate--beta-alanine ligase [bacterium]|nr:MAG: pantoate--beta-alanine ligase [bacterium]